MSKQVEFPEKQTHSKQFEMACWVVSIACIVFCIIAIQTVGGGGL